MKLNRNLTQTIIALAFGFLLSATASRAQTPWKLIWSDEFNGAAGTQPDSKNWKYDVGKTGWGNKELETYTNAAENAHMDGQGNLDIRVENPSPDTYTSARIKTLGLFSVQYGRIEARIKLPVGQGIWPAFWMLGTDITSVSWPQCGEIDIMENVGGKPNVIYGTVHGPNYKAGTTYSLPSDRASAEDFHIYAVDWSPEAITFSVDGNAYKTITRSDAGKGWVFNKPFYILFNVAVGGINKEPPNSTTKFPLDMLVDYVRVYQQASGATDSPR